jgi:hypothetical protein
MKPKILPLSFYDTTVTPKEPGLKNVLFRIEFEQTGQLIGFDWGYANFEKGKFEELLQEKRRAKVVKWAEMPDPQLIL